MAGEALIKIVWPGFIFFFFPALRPYDPERSAESVEALSAVLDIREAFALFIFTVCVRPLGSLPLCSSLLSPGEEHPEAEPAPAAQAEWKAFLPIIETDGLIGSPNSPCAGWSEQSGRLRELQLCSQARQEQLHLFPFLSKHIAGQGQVIFLRAYGKPNKSQACCMFPCHSPGNDLLPDWLMGSSPPAGAAQPEGQPSLRDTPGRRGPACTRRAVGQKLRDQRQRDNGVKRIYGKETAPSHTGP